jgi:hypothetical protein
MKLIADHIFEAPTSIEVLRADKSVNISLLCYMSTLTLAGISSCNFCVLFFTGENICILTVGKQVHGVRVIKGQ